LKYQIKKYLKKIVLTIKLFFSYNIFILYSRKILGKKFLFFDKPNEFMGIQEKKNPTSITFNTILPICIYQRAKILLNGFISS